MTQIRIFVNHVDRSFVVLVNPNVNVINLKEEISRLYKEICGFDLFIESLRLFTFGCYELYNGYKISDVLCDGSIISTQVGISDNNRSFLRHQKMCQPICNGQTEQLFGHPNLSVGPTEIQSNLVPVTSYSYSIPTSFPTSFPAPIPASAAVPSPASVNMLLTNQQNSSSMKFTDSQIDNSTAVNKRKRLTAVEGPASPKKAKVDKNVSKVSTKSKKTTSSSKTGGKVPPAKNSTESTKKKTDKTKSLKDKNSTPAKSAKSSTGRTKPSSLAISEQQKVTTKETSEEDGDEEDEISDDVATGNEASDQEFKGVSPIIQMQNKVESLPDKLKTQKTNGHSQLGTPVKTNIKLPPPAEASKNIKSFPKQQEPSEIEDSESWSESGSETECEVDDMSSLTQNTPLHELAKDSAITDMKKKVSDKSSSRKHNSSIVSSIKKM
jgi:hypothetical protein